MPALATSFQYNIARFSQDNKRRVIIGTEVGKEELMLHLLTGNMILYVENSDVSKTKTTVRTSKQIQESGRMKNQHAEITYVSIYQQ